MKKHALFSSILHLEALLLSLGLVVACTNPAHQTLIDSGTSSHGQGESVQFATSLPSIVPTAFMGPVTPAPKEKTFSVDEVNACHADEDCVLVQAGYCGGAEAINLLNMERWNQFLEGQKKEFEKTPIACAPSLPLDQFEPLCLNRQCAAVFIQQHGLLAFGADPLVGQPVPLRFSLVYADDTPGVQATLLLQEGIEKLSGDLAWQGDLRKGQEHTVEAQVRVSQPGCYVVRARAIPQVPAASQASEAVVYLKATTSEVRFRRQPEAIWDMRYSVPVTENADPIHSRLTFLPVSGEADRYLLTYQVNSEVDLSGAGRAELTLLLPRDAFIVRGVHYPPGGELFNHGTQVTWQGQIPANQTVELTLDLKLIQPGFGPVYGFLMVEPGGSIQNRIIDVVDSELYLCE